MQSQNEIVERQQKRTIQANKGNANALFLKALEEEKNQDYKNAISHFSSALEIYTKKNNKDSIVLCYKKIGIAYYYSNDFNNAIKNLHYALPLYKELGDNKSVSGVYNAIAVSYSESGEFDKMFEYYNKTLVLCKEIKHENGIVTCYNNIGVAYDDIGNYPLAIENYKKALRTAKRIDNKGIVYRALNNIGLVYKRKGDYDKALAYFEESLAMMRALNVDNDIIRCLNNIGNIYIKKENNDKAESFYNEALDIANKISDARGISLCYNNLGHLHLDKENYDSALMYYKKASVLKEEAKHISGYCSSKIGIATAYVEKDEHRKALSHVLESKKIADDLGLLDYQKKNAELLSIIYQKLGNYKKSLENYKVYKVISDSVFNKKSIERIAQLEYKTKLDSASVREIKLKQKVLTTTESFEKSKQNLLLIIIGLLIIIMVASTLIFYLRLRAEREKTENIVIEQKLLRSQMTPHFIFNSLSVLQGIILNKEEEKSVFYLSKFSRLLRLILESSREKTVLLKQELEAVDSYITLQNLDGNLPYNYTLNISEDIDVHAIKIPPMLIQPFVENAIEHAFDHQNKDKKIEINLFFCHNKLCCTILDNGIGVDALKEKQKANNKKSLATTITTERLNLLSKNFKEKGSLTIEDRKKHNAQGTLVTLMIPYIKIA